MATLNNTPTHSPNGQKPDENAQLHNSRISESYRRLQETVDKQLDEIERERSAAAAEKYSVAGTATIERERPATHKTYAPTVDTMATPSVAPAPFRHEKPESDLFRAETLDRVIRNSGYAPAETYAPTDFHAPARETETKTLETTEVVAEAKGELSTFAKTVMAVFSAIIVMMFTMICINTQVLEQKAAQIVELEQTRSELMERNVRLRSQIEEATSDETIEEFALANGMVKAE